MEKIASGIITTNMCSSGERLSELSERRGLIRAPSDLEVVNKLVATFGSSTIEKALAGDDYFSRLGAATIITIGVLTLGEEAVNT